MLRIFQESLLSSEKQNAKYILNFTSSDIFKKRQFIILNDDEIDIIVIDSDAILVYLGPLVEDPNIAIWLFPDHLKQNAKLMKGL